MRKILILFFVSIFTLTLVSAGPLDFLFSSSEEEIIQTIEYTQTTDKTCNNGVCNLVLYSGIRNVEEDDTWKRVEDAKSLKDKGFNIIINSDEVHLVDVIDFNYTSIEFDLSFDAENLGEYEYEVEDGKMKTKFKIVEYNDSGDLIETEYEVEIEEEGLNYKYKGNPLGKEFHFGENSTTLILQDADTENLDDTSLRKSNDLDEYGAVVSLQLGQPEYFGKLLTKFNISSIPSGAKITDSNLNLYAIDNTLDAGESISARLHDVYNFPNYNVSGEEWTEGDCTSIFGCLAISPEVSHTTSPNSSSSYNLAVESSLTWDSGSAVDTWYVFSANNSINRCFSEGNSNCTLMLDSIILGGTPGTTGDSIKLTSKEHATSSERPYLNITYTEESTPSSQRLFSLKEGSRLIFKGSGRLSFKF